MEGKGKCLVAQRDITAGEVVFTETPLVCLPDLRQAGAVCAHCLKGCVTPSQQVRAQLGLEEALPYEAESYHPGPLARCADCHEVYCAPHCRDAALAYHRLLCSRVPPPQPSLMGALTELCAPYDFVGPLIIARIFSSIIQHCLMNPGPDGLRTCALFVMSSVASMMCHGWEAYVQDSMR